MIERIERVAPLRVPAVMPWRRRAGQARPAGSVLAMPRGEIAGDVRLLSRSDRDRSATYEVLVANDTAGRLAAFAYATNAKRGPGRITWNAMVVPPFSAIAVEIDVAIPRRGRPPRVIAEVHAEDAQLTLDSAPQLPLYSREAIRRAAVLAGASIVALAALVGIVGTRPQVTALAAPTRVLAGTEFSVAYALADASGGVYTIEAPNGLQLRRGTLAPGSGAFTVALPPGKSAGGYDVNVFANGRFGADERTVHVVSYVPPPPRVSHRAVDLKISNLGLASETVVAGNPIIVNYKTLATTGFVRLIDEYGTVRAEALLSHTGTSMLAAPLVDADQDLRVVVTAERGTAHDEAQISVRVLRATVPPGGDLVAQAGRPLVPAIAPIAGGDPNAAQDDAATASGAPAQTILPVGPLPAGADVPVAPAPGGVRRALPILTGAPIAVERAQDPAQPILVRVLHYEPRLRVSVLGKSGEELEGANVQPGDTVVSLSSPNELGTRHPSVIATYANGSAQETIVRPLVVR